MRKKNTYAPDFKLSTIRLIKEKGRSVKSVALEIGVNELIIYRWLKKYEQEGDSAFVNKRGSESVISDISSLRRENAELKEDIATLKKAALIFFKH